MTYKQANRRYLTTIFASMATFVVASMGLAWAAKADLVPMPWLWIASIIPVVALLMPIWALWRYIGEVDEFLRSLQLKAILFGLAVMLPLASSWGYVEMYFDAPQISMYWLNPIFWIAYATGLTYFSRRDGVEL